MPRLHNLTVRASTDPAPPPLRPYRWRRRRMTRTAALKAAGLGTARIPPAPERRHHDD